MTSFEIGFMKRTPISLGSWLIGVLLAFVVTTDSVAGLPMAEPDTVGLDAQKLDGINEIVAEGLGEKKMPGCVVCVGRHGKIAFFKAFGQKQLQPTELPMTTDTLFDMASITKPMATATSIMLLIERGKLQLTDTVASILPEFAAKGKEPITIHDLLIHHSGLLADNSIKDYEQGRDEAIKRICELKLLNPIGTKFVYSDVNFILLGEIVRRVSEKNVHEFSREHIFAPLGMKSTGYLPSETLRANAAPTEQRDGKWMQGEVHDPRAFKLGGVAGHAGLFSTADDVAIYAQMMLGRGEYAGMRVLLPETVERMTRGDRVSSGVRGLGWDKRTGYSTNRGELLTDSAFGHGGFTGTVLWIDPELDLFFVFLSNRVHPSGKGSVNQLAGRIATTVASAIRNKP